MGCRRLGWCVCRGGGRGRRRALRSPLEAPGGGRARLPSSEPTSPARQPRLAAPTVPVVEAAAPAAALPSPHTDNMAAAEEETHGSAASRRDQSEAAPATAGSGNPLFQEAGRDGLRPRPQRNRAECRRAGMSYCTLGFLSGRGCKMEGVLKVKHDIKGLAMISAFDSRTSKNWRERQREPPPERPIGLTQPRWRPPGFPHSAR